MCPLDDVVIFYALITRDHMDMEVEHGLSGGFLIILEHIHTITAKHLFMWIASFFASFMESAATFSSISYRFA